MPEDTGRSGQSSTLDILAKLELRRAAIMKTIAGVDEQNTAIRCDTLRNMFDELYRSIRRNIAPLEQNKGIKAGLELGAAALATNRDLWKTELDQVEDADKLEFALKVIDRGLVSINGAAQKQRAELNREAGKFDGAVNSAMSLLDQIEKLADHLARSKVKQAEIEQGGNGVGQAGDEVDQALEQQADKRRAQLEGGGNGATVTPIAAAKKKAPAKKKGPQKKRRATKKKTTPKTTN
jgi:hypothetical protein